MNKRYLLGLLLIFCIAGVKAQKDTEAQEILEKAANKALAYKTIYTQFEFIVENAQNESKETYKGELWIKGDMFKMDVDNTITISDGKSRWVYLPEAEEVNVSNVEKGEDLDPEELFLVDPLSIFTMYKKGFKYVISGTQSIEGKEHSVVDLSPEDLNKPYFKIKCWISNDYNYNALKYFQKDGTRITLQLKQTKTDEKYKDALFIFNEKDHPNVEVIDLRE